MRRILNRSISLVKNKKSESVASFPVLMGRELKDFLLDLSPSAKKKSHVLVLNLSLFNIGRQHRDYLRVIEENLEENFKSKRGRVFTAQQGDIVCVYESARSVLPQKLIEQVRTFFSEDVFSAGTSEKEVFFEHYHLGTETDYEAFLKTMKRILRAQKKYVTPTITGKHIRSAPRHHTPLLPENYPQICEKLATVELRKAIHSQPICSFPSKAGPLIEARELYVHSTDFQKMVCPTIDILTDPWLFQSLTHFFDQAILKELLLHGTRYGSTPLNLNLNISTILSDLFLEWDASQTALQRKKTTIELQKIDIFCDVGAYQYVCHFLHAKGYKVCLDSLTHLTLPLVQWRELNVDFLKLYWSQELERSPSFLKDLKEVDRKKIILAHCEEPKAIRWGIKEGFTLFQGWHVDQLLMPGYS